MLTTFRDEPGDAQRGMARREVLRIGGLSALGLTSIVLEQLRARAGTVTSVARHRAKLRVLIFLLGGPSHIDLWDMKPDAPAEIRGEFTATILHHLGIDIHEECWDEFQQMPRKLSVGSPIKTLG